LSNGKDLHIAGLASERWVDCLGSVTVGEGEIASRVLATDTNFLIPTSTMGIIAIWHAETCEESGRLNHDEYVLVVAFNRFGTRHPTAGILTHRILDKSSGKEFYCVPKTAEGLTMTTAFGLIDSQLLVGVDDCSVARYDLETSPGIARFEARRTLQDIQGYPNIMVINPDSRKVAIAWRGKLPLIWDVSDPLTLYKCRVSESSDH
jgi:hypothetical protein